MKKNQKKGILFIILAVAILFLGGELIIQIFGFDAFSTYFNLKLNFLIPLIFIVLGIRSFLNKKNEESVEDNFSVVNSSQENNQSDKFSKAGNYLISAANKFLAAIGLQIISLFITFKMTQNANSIKSVESAEKFGLLISIIVLSIGIAAILDIKKAGENLKN